MNEFDFTAVLPEVILSLYAMGALLVAVYGGKDRMAPALVWVTAAVMATAGLWILVVGRTEDAAFATSFRDDAFAQFGKVGILLSGAVVLLMSESYMARRNLLRFEYPVLVVLASVLRTSQRCACSCTSQLCADKCSTTMRAHELRLIQPENWWLCLCGVVLWLYAYFVVRYAIDRCKQLQ